MLDIVKRLQKTMMKMSRNEQREGRNDGCLKMGMGRGRVRGRVTGRVRGCLRSPYYNFICYFILIFYCSCRDVIVVRGCVLSKVFLKGRGCAEGKVLDRL